MDLVTRNKEIFHIAHLVSIPNLMKFCNYYYFFVIKNSESKISFCWRINASLPKNKTKVIYCSIKSINDPTLYRTFAFREKSAQKKYLFFYFLVERIFIIVKNCYAFGNRFIFKTAQNGNEHLSFKAKKTTLTCPTPIKTSRTDSTKEYR